MITPTSGPTMTPRSGLVLLSVAAGGGLEAVEGVVEVWVVVIGALGEVIVRVTVVDDVITLGIEVVGGSETLESVVDGIEEEAVELVETVGSIDVLGATTDEAVRLVNLERVVDTDTILMDGEGEGRFTVVEGEVVEDEGAACCTVLEAGGSGGVEETSVGAVIFVSLNRTSAM